MSPWRNEFPAIINHPDYIFFDNAATTQKPQTVINSMTNLWESGVMAINRSSCQLANEQAQLVEKSLQTIANFFGAKKNNLIITKSATEALNLIIYNFTHLLRPDEKVILSKSNHSSNLVGWNKFFPVEYLNFLNTGHLDLQQLTHYTEDEKVRVISLNLVSNVFGHQENLKNIIHLVQKANKIRQKKIYLIVDAAAAVSSLKINFLNTDIDFMIVSGHKMYGPFIAGIIGKNNLLGENFLPSNLGGGNITYQSEKGWQLFPHSQKYFAGVTDLVAIIGWASACQWLEKNQAEKNHYLHHLTETLITHLKKINGINILGESKKTHLVTFTYQGYSYQDIMAYLSSKNFCVRGGQHCAQLIYQDLKLDGAIRISLGIYNQIEEIEELISQLRHLPDNITPSCT